jgi:hypothetical protein
MKHLQKIRFGICFIGIISVFFAPGLAGADPYDYDFSSLWDDDWDTYLDYSSQLFDEYYQMIEPSLNDHLEKSMERFDEYWTKVSPYQERMLNDPNYSWQDYMDATKSYREEYFRESSREFDDYISRTRPFRDAYFSISNALSRDFYDQQQYGGGVSRADFDQLMREFHRKTSALLAANRVPERVTPPKPPSGSKAERALSERIRQYSSQTGIYDRNLIGLYAEADRNKDNKLSIRELKEFQENLVVRFDYVINSTALDPAQFLNQGGGDCEDWSIVTAGLLRFWGIQAYIGTIESPNDPVGHAVCLIRYATPPRDLLYWEITGTYGLDGYYVPIDYQVVGGLSSWLFSDWPLTNIYTPEEIYGWWM